MFGIRAEAKIVAEEIVAWYDGSVIETYRIYNTK